MALENVSLKFQKAVSDVERVETLIAEIQCLESEDGAAIEKMVEICEILGIESGQWLQLHETDRIQTAVKWISGELDKVKKSASPYLELNGDELLTRACHEVECQGLLLSQNEKELFQSREKAIDQVKGRLTIPSKSQWKRVENFKTEVECEKFDPTQLGLGFKRKVNDDGVHSCTASYTTVSVISVEIDRTSLKWSPRCIESLITIDRLIRDVGKNEQEIQEKCKNFLQRHGSHVGIGPIHFGGIYTFVATYPEAESATDKSAIDKIQRAYFHQCSVGPSVPGYGSSGCDTASILATTNAKCVSIGGPGDVRTFPSWKMGLVLNPRSWEIVDRGPHFLGIWDVIRNDEYTRSYFEKVAELIKKSWLDNWGNELLKCDSINTESDIVTYRSVEDTSCEIADPDHIPTKQPDGQILKKVGTGGAVTYKSSQGTSRVTADHNPIPTKQPDKQMLKKVGTAGAVTYKSSQGTSRVTADHNPIPTKQPDKQMLKKVGTAGAVTYKSSQGTSRVTADHNPSPTEQPDKQILQKIGIEGPITYKQALSIARRIPTTEDKFNLTHVPWVMLEQLLMGNYMGRQLAWESMVGQGRDSDSSDDDVYRLFAKLNTPTPKEIPDPIDIFLSVYKCCDMRLKQLLCEKMFMCHLSVPFIIPDQYKQNSTYCLSSLQTIEVACRKKNGDSIETFLLNCPMHVVSFVRLGDIGFSKSEIMNMILSSKNHQTFFHKNSCRIDADERKICNGLVEAAWYLPSGKKDDVFEDVTMLLNLRGDASNFPKQSRFMASISSVFVFCTPVCSLGDQRTMSALKNACKSASSAVMLVLSGSTRVANADEMLSACFKEVEDEGIKPPIPVITTKNNKENSTYEIRNLIQEKLHKQLDKQPLKFVTGMTDVDRHARIAGIALDDNESLKKGKNLAHSTWLPMVDMSGADIKQKYLRMQCEYWPELCELEKTKKRANRQAGMISLEERERTQIQILKVRQKQTTMNSTFLKSFTTTLRENINHCDVTHAYLQGLKFEFDKLSKKDIPHLRKRYTELWSKYNQPEGIGTKQKSKQTATNQLQQAEKDLAKASCGLEHILRETGQSFEARKESKVQIDDATRGLPEIGAKLLLQGHPLELLDGDAGNIPLMWIKAVLDELTKLTGKGKKVFVVSVLGVQSSGKSTLMNIMFGLRFAVCAGRCTRGVYMQLIAVKREETELPIDYILVVDTEGLRAIELSREMYEHDNQLATFAIGLADIAIVNIMGENASEINDILQIVVHAFLRMSIATKNAHLKQSCVFVHQNVSATNAEEKMTHGRQKLIDSLNEMTTLAAEQEGHRDIHAFSDVIHFDGEQFVWYFPNLWDGNPPMAPINPSYCEKVAEVRQRVLNLAKRRGTYFSISNVKDRISDLWNAILSEDFVFSFRNTLAIKAYRVLEDEYLENKWKLEQKLTEWTTKTAFQRLERCENERKLNEEYSALSKELTEKVSELTEQHVQEMKKFIENSSSHREIIIQWQEQKLTSLRLSADDMESSVRTKMKRKMEFLNFNFESRARGDECDKLVISKASALAETLKGTSPNEETLHSVFDKEWDQWVKSIIPRQTTTFTPVDVKVEKILFDRLKAESHILKDLLKEYPLKSTRCNSQITELTDRGFRVGTDHVGLHSLKKRLYSLFKNFEEQCVKEAQTITKTICETTNVYLNDIAAQDTVFHDSHATDVIRQVTSAIDEHNAKHSKEAGFDLTIQYKVRLVLYVCRHAVKIFTKMQDSFNEKHSPEKRLREMKKAAFNLFCNKVKNCTSEIVAADLLCDCLEKLIKKNVEETLPDEIVSEFILSFGKKKYMLIITILDDLADRGDFLGSITYIRSPHEYALKWLTQHMNSKLFGKRTERDTRYTEMAGEKVDSILTKTANVIKGISLSKLNIGDLVKNFCDNMVGILAVREDELSPVLKQGVDDLQSFKERVRIRLRTSKDMKDRLIKHFKTDEKRIKWPAGKTPYSSVLEKIWGCSEHCPFCREPCQFNDPHHADNTTRTHSCIQHRPVGIRGTKWKRDCQVDGRAVKEGELNIQMCGYSIQTTTQFNCASCGNKCRDNGCKSTDNDDDDTFHEYIEYKKWAPEWDIAPCAENNNAKYWMWFMATYAQQLKEHYSHAKHVYIPESWKSITKKEAKDSLREIYA